MAGTLRNPRAVLTLGGAQIPLLSAEVTLNTLASSDTAHCEFALNDPAFDLSVLDAGEVEMTIAITGGGAGGGLLFTGKVTQDAIVFERGTVTIQGEDKTAALLKKKSVESFKNKKHSEVAEDIAKRHGLSVDADGETLKAGKIFQIDHVFLTDHSEWQVLQRMAEREGLSVVIDKQNASLAFKREDEGDLPVFPVRYTPPSADGPAFSDAITIRSVKNHKIATKTKVNVRSWNVKQKKAITSEKEADGGSGEATTYDYRVPNLTQDQADRIAEKKLGENTRHELSIEIEMPGDATIPARSKVQVSGTGTARDQAYFVDTISHRIGFGDGWRMTITGKNKADKKGNGA